MGGPDSGETKPSERTIEEPLEEGGKRTERSLKALLSGRLWELRTLLLFLGVPSSVALFFPGGFPAWIKLLAAESTEAAALAETGFLLVFLAAGVEAEDQLPLLEAPFKSRRNFQKPVEPGL